MQGWILWLLICSDCRYIGDKVNYLFYISFFCCQGGFPWPKNLTAFGLVQCKLAPILEWWSNGLAQASVPVKKCQS